MWCSYQAYGMMPRINLFRVLTLALGLMLTNGQESFELDDRIRTLPLEYYNITDNTRFLIFEVNLGEGFNLRRDVYIRAANMIKKMNDKGEDWILILPEWMALYHWKTKKIQQRFIPWGQFFDLPSMNIYIPVMEFNVFWDNFGSKSGIDHVINLQLGNKDVNSTLKTGSQYSIHEECTNNGSSAHYYRQDKNGRVRGIFYQRREVYAHRFDCYSVRGKCEVLAGLLKDIPGRYIFVDRFEKVMHCEVRYNFERDQARRSLVFSKHLREEADSFRAEFLDSNDEKDKTVFNDDDWRLQVADLGEALGGPYLAIHLRLDDWKTAHKKTAISLEQWSIEIKEKLEEYGLDKVYVATDGTDEEIDKLQSYLSSAKIYRYPNNQETVKKFSDGGIAIIDQWIAAHARYFIGTCHSTFTYRIKEERSILGLPVETTYNCGGKSESDPYKQPPLSPKEGEKLRNQRLELAQKVRQERSKETAGKPLNVEL